MSFGSKGWICGERVTLQLFGLRTTSQNFPHEFIRNMNGKPPVFFHCNSTMLNHILPHKFNFYFDLL